MIDNIYINNNYVTISLAIVVVLVLVYCYKLYYTIDISGFYRASDEFCIESDLELLILNINDSDRSSSHLSGYMLMKNEEGFIINDPVTINYKRNRNGSNYTEYNVELVWPDKKDYYFFPKKQKLKYYKSLGKLEFIDDKQEITAVLYKDYIMGDIDEPDHENTTRVGDAEPIGNSIV